MSRCRTLIAENQELGKQLSQGKVAQLEAELALQKKYSEDLKQSQEGGFVCCAGNDFYSVPSYGCLARR